MKPKSKANKRQRPTGVALRRLVRRPDDIPRRPGVVLVYLDVINAWDIGWHCGHHWWSKTYGAQYEIIFWMNLPVENWIGQCLTLASSSHRLAAVRLGVADAFFEKSKSLPKARFLAASPLCERGARQGRPRLRLPLFGSQTKHDRLASQQNLRQLPFESYLHVLYSPYCEIAARSPNEKS
jgi:hypothetical protein